MTASEDPSLTVRPNGMPAAARRMWTRLYATDRVRGFTAAFRQPFPPLVRAVEDGSLSPLGPMLDVGCGLGANACWLAERGVRVTGIDLAPGAVAAAIAARPPTARNPTFVEDDILASTLPAGSFRTAIDVGCFQTIPPRLRRTYSDGLARVLVPGGTFVLFWVGREEVGRWGPPHRLSVTEVTGAFEGNFIVDRVEFRPRTIRLTARVRRTHRPLATLAGYTARLVRRRAPHPPAR